MRDLEIPLKSERDWKYRMGEILPGAVSWTTILLPFILSFTSPTLAAYFIILFMLAWLVKAFGFAVRTALGYNRLMSHMRLYWPTLLNDLKHPKRALAKLKETGQYQQPQWHYDNLAKLASMEQAPNPDDIIHAVIMPTYNEPPEVIEPTIQSLIDAKFDTKQHVIFLLAYEQRAGEEKARQSNEQIAKFGHHFLYAEAIGHPADLPNEVIGKGGNATWAGRRLEEVVKQRGLDPENVVVTTLDSDNRPHPHYFSALTYAYVMDEQRKYKSFQPIPMFLNNIWDAPAPMRVLATGNSFWNLISSTRPQLIAQRPIYWYIPYALNWPATVLEQFNKSIVL